MHSENIAYINIKNPQLVNLNPKLHEYEIFPVIGKYKQDKIVFKYNEYIPKKERDPDYNAFGEYHMSS